MFSIFRIITYFCIDRRKSQRIIVREDPAMMRSDQKELIDENEKQLNLISQSKDFENEINSIIPFEEPFYFIQGADTQFGMIDSYLKGLEKPGWEEEIKLSEQLVSCCNSMEPKPKFMVICGDLVDAMPDKIQLKNEQIKDFKKIFSKLDNNIPLVCLCGNHDLGDEPTIKSIQDYKNDFGEDFYYFIKNGILFIILNSQFYKNRDFVNDYAREQDLWLEKLLKKCKYFKYSIVFQHIPWFINEQDEDDVYYNIDKVVRLKWLNKFMEAGISKIFCGHYHRNGGGWFYDELNRNNKLELIVTSAIGAQSKNGTDKSGIRIVKVLDDNIEHKYYSLYEIPKKISLSPNTEDI